MSPRRARLTTLGVGVPLLFAALAACGGDEPSATFDGAAGRGQQLARTRGCAACHGASGQGGLGPAWTGRLGTEIDLKGGGSVVVDEAYLTESITDPEAKIAAGFSVTMPKTSLSDDEVADLVAYILALNE
jgi:cytochrome c oxidase subunit 2